MIESHHIGRQELEMVSKPKKGKGKEKEKENVCTVHPMLLRLKMVASSVQFMYIESRRSLITNIHLVGCLDH